MENKLLQDFKNVEAACAVAKLTLAEHQAVQASLQSLCEVIFPKVQPLPMNVKDAGKN